MYNIREMLIGDIDNVTNMMCDVFDKENIFLKYRQDKIKEELNLAFMVIVVSVLSIIIVVM